MQGGTNPPPCPDTPSPFSQAQTLINPNPVTDMDRNPYTLHSTSLVPNSNKWTNMINRSKTLKRFNVVFYSRQLVINYKVGWHKPIFSTQGISYFRTRKRKAEKKHWFFSHISTNDIWYICICLGMFEGNFQTFESKLLISLHGPKPYMDATCYICLQQALLYK